MAQACEECSVRIGPEERVVQAMQPVVTRDDQGDFREMNGTVVYVHECEWFENNARGERELARGTMREFEPAG